MFFDLTILAIFFIDLNYKIWSVCLLNRIDGLFLCVFFGSRAFSFLSSPDSILSTRYLRFSGLFFSYSLYYYYFLTFRIVLLFWHSDFYSLYNRNTLNISNSLFEVWNLDWNKLRKMKPLNGGFRWSWLFILLLINEGFLAGEKREWSENFTANRIITLDYWLEIKPKLNILFTSSSISFSCCCSQSKNH